MSEGVRPPGERLGPATLPQPDATPALTARIARGDREALARLYEERFDGMYRTAAAVTGRDESFCLDVVQEAFVRLIRAMPALPNEAALVAFLRRTVLSAAFDMLRREKRRAARERRAASERPEAVMVAGEPLLDRLRAIESQIAQVDEELAGLLEMRHRFGWTLARIGSFLGMSPSAVDGRLTRAERRLARESGRD